MNRRHSNGKRPRRRAVWRRGQARRDTTIAWCNVGRNLSAHIYLLQACYDQGIDIIHVQEPWTAYDTKTQNHPAYESYAPLDSWTEEDERPRVMSYVRVGARLQAQQRRLATDSRDLLWLEVNDQLYLNFYREPAAAPVMDYLVQLDPPPKCVIGGDANAVDNVWEPGSGSQHRGGQLASWSCETGMVYTGQPGVPTQRAGHVLDLVFSNIPFAATRVRPDLRTGSDHETLVTTVPGRGNEPLDQFHLRVPESDLGLFADTLAVCLSSLSDPEGLSGPDAVDRWTAQFAEAWGDALGVVGRPSRPVARSAPWWTGGCKAAQAEWRKADAMRPDSLSAPPDEKRLFHTTVRKAKKEYWRGVIDGYPATRSYTRLSVGTNSAPG
jgi:hypothetical protein